MARSPLLVLGTVFLVALLSASGCAPGAAPSSSASTGIAAVIDTYLDGDEAAGYSDAQVEVLTRARASGELGFEDYAAAIDRTLECIGAAGYYTQKDPVDNSRGFPTVNYFYESPEDGNPVAEQCIYENSQAIEAVYQLQPSAVEAAQVHLETLAGAFQRCLRALGIDADFEGLKGDELVAAIHHYDSEMALEAVETGTPARCDSKASY